MVKFLLKKNCLTIEDISRDIHAHPELSETIQEAAHTTSGRGS